MVITAVVMNMVTAVVVSPLGNPQQIAIPPWAGLGGNLILQTEPGRVDGEVMGGRRDTE